jgi:hypothetical protein
MRTTLVPFFARFGAWREESTVVHNLVTAKTNLVVNPVRHEREVVLKGLEVSDGNLDLLHRGLVEDCTPHFLHQIDGHQVLQKLCLKRRHGFFRKDILEHIHQLFDSEARENFELVRHGQTDSPFFSSGLFHQFLQLFRPFYTIDEKSWGFTRFLTFSSILQPFGSYRIVTSVFPCFQQICGVFVHFQSLRAFFHRYRRFYNVSDARFRRFYMFCVHFRWFSPQLKGYVFRRFFKRLRKKSKNRALFQKLDYLCL